MYTQRIFIYPSDISALTGKHMTTARRIYRQILDSLNKTKLQGLTIQEYCKYTGSDERLVSSLIK
jgi:hypothetical protein